ncbi:hypothetical protein I7I51_02881 [Histoplasma capsulatum]|uniref:Uncharacterized protein n=1 Tax=Ajellomyces capsulatus TaxID=5037 RepID=A0A8A1MPV3_AJECA|nr:hypothetical protein I7I51_02881 [Histoplasma capsulatum]
MAYKKLFNFLTEKSGKGVQKIISLTTSYYIILYESQNRRDTGLQKLKDAKFEVNGHQTEVVLAKFGDVGGTGPYTYQITREHMDTAQDVQGALNALFKADR